MRHLCLDRDIKSPLSRSVLSWSRLESGPKCLPGRDKERVRGDVVDEREFPPRMLWKSAEGVALGSLCTCGYAKSEGEQRKQRACAGSPAQRLTPGEPQVFSSDV